MVETCLPGDDLDVQNPYPSSLGIAANLNLSSSMSSLSMGSLHSPTDKDSGDGGAGCGNGTRLRHGSANHAKHRVGSFKRKNSKSKKSPDGLEWVCYKYCWYFCCFATGSRGLNEVWMYARRYKCCVLSLVKNINDLEWVRWFVQGCRLLWCRDECYRDDSIVATDGLVLTHQAISDHDTVLEHQDILDVNLYVLMSIKNFKISYGVGKSPSNTRVDSI